MERMEKQFEGLGENLYKKMHQARGLWDNQKTIALSFFKCIRKRLWTTSIFATG